MNWKKTTPYGDYRETPDRKIGRMGAQSMVVRAAQHTMINGKHAGSKPLDRIKRALKRYNEAVSLNKQ